MINPAAQIDVNLTPCFDHATLSDLLEGAGLTWKYYTNHDYDIWTAPNGIQHICLPQGSPIPAPCTNPDFVNHVVAHPSSILNSINPVTSTGHQPICSLANVSWVIPNGTWSDHPGLTSNGLSTDIEGGPNWVASIVNALGNSACVDSNGQTYWQDSVIFVVWDDWGGFNDHILPYKVDWNCSTWGCGYTYGFRVPFLVVSAYTPAGYVSGPCTQGVNCPNSVAPYQHDFGSILAFIEHNFGLPVGGINPQYQFADYWAPELQANRSAVPLADFFQGAYRGFVPITPASTSFTNDYFLNYSGPPVDPDNDLIDPQN